MQKTFLSALFSLIFVFSLSSQVIDTVLVDYEWENMNLPNFPTLSMARSNNRLFAGTERGLFYSENDGEDWIRIPELYDHKIGSVVAKGNTVVATYGKPTQSVPGSGGSFTYFNWVSKDEGMTFDTILPLLLQSAGAAQVSSNPYIFAENSFGQFRKTGLTFSTYSELLLWTETDGEWNLNESIIYWDSSYAFFSAGVENNQPYYNIRKNDFLLRHFFDENTGMVLSVDTLIQGSASSHFSGDTITYASGNTVHTSTDYGDSFFILAYPQLDSTMTESYFDKQQNRYYFQNNDIIYQQNIDDPSILDTIFVPHREMVFYEKNYFFIDENYLWIHSLNRLYRSNKDVINWTIKDDGIANLSFDGPYGFEINQIGDEFWIAPDGTSGSPEHYVFSNNNNNSLYLDTDLLGIQIPLTKIGDRYLTEINGEWHWSLDAINYESYGITKQASYQPPPLKKIDDTYYIMENDRILLTNDLAETFDSISIPGRGNLFVKGDTMAIYPNRTTRHLSSDYGMTWVTQQIAIPYNQTNYSSSSWLYQYNDTLYTFHNLNGFYYSTDWGESWTQSVPGEYLFLYSSYPTVYNHIVGVEDSLVLANIKGDLWATTNFGQSWTILDNVPFSKEGYYFGINFTYIYFRLNLAHKYYLINGQFYAFTSGYGVLRTPVENLLAAMSPASYSDMELSASCPAYYKIYEPIPYQIVVTNKGATDATEITIRAPLPNGLVYTSDTVTSGEYNLYYEEWKIDYLAAGEKDTLNLTLFPLIDNSEIRFFTQIIHAKTNPDDWDSSPGNNSLEEIPEEDDEALVVSFPYPSIELKGEKFFNLTFFPNPAKDNLFLKTQESGFYNIKIVNINGQISEDKNVELVPDSAIKFDIRELPSGIYFIHGSSGNQQFVIPFIKE